MICSFDAFLRFCRTLKKSLPSQSAEREKNDEASPLSSAPLESKEEGKTTF